jgi:MerR family mercuric resistance operon transcriptional regulator
MESNPGSLTIGAFAEAAGVNVETIRFYQRKGLLPEPGRLHGRIRRYGESDVKRPRFVKSAQRLGFSLGEIAALLRLDPQKSTVGWDHESSFANGPPGSSELGDRLSRRSSSGMVRPCTMTEKATTANVTVTICRR